MYFGADKIYSLNVLDFLLYININSFSLISIEGGYLIKGGDNK